MKITKREYFAAKFMQAFLSQPMNDNISTEDLLELAVLHADKLIKKLEEKQNPQIKLP